MAKRPSRFGGSIGPPEPCSKRTGGLGGLFRTRSVPDPGEPMKGVSPPIPAGAGPNGGHFVSKCVPLDMGWRFPPITPTLAS